MTREEAKKIILKHQFAFASLPDEVVEAVNYLIKEEQELTFTKDEVLSILKDLHISIDATASNLQNKIDKVESLRGNVINEQMV